jgi:hypothetical protein
MIYIGLLCFGLFVGTLLCVGILFIADMASWQKAITFILAITASGAMFKFLDILGTKDHPDALAGYPIGLFIALLWSFCGYANARIQSTDKRYQFFGWMHLAGVVGVTTVLVTYTVLQAPMGSMGNQVVFGLAVVLAFGVIGFLIYNAVLAMQRNHNGNGNRPAEKPE